jgi:hypothetical protein
MRIVAFVVALLTASSLCLASSSPAAAGPSVEDLFRQFDLLGNWAIDCEQPAAPANPHVRILISSPGTVLEEHDLGDEFAVNRYSVVAASRLSAERLSVEVNFKPSDGDEQRQKLILLIRKATRRTMFNQPDGGEVRVKDGVALAHGVKTPVLRKCG